MGKTFHTFFLTASQTQKIPLKLAKIGAVVITCVTNSFHQELDVKAGGVHLTWAILATEVIKLQKQYKRTATERGLVIWAMCHLYIGDGPCKMEDG